MPETKNKERVLATDEYVQGIPGDASDANNGLKEQVKKKLITEDEERRAQDEIQKITDRYIKEVDKLLTSKEADLMEV